MATETKTYDPAGIAISIGGAIITGVEPGTFVTVVRSQNTWEQTIGPDGIELIRTKKNDRSALFTLTLRQSAPSNKILSNLANRDEKDSDGIVPVSITDINSPDTVYMTGKGYIQKPADGAYGDVPQPRVWQIFLSEVPMVHGGTPATPALTDTLSA